MIGHHSIHHSIHHFTNRANQYATKHTSHCIIYSSTPLCPIYPPQGCNYAILNGADLSRARVVTFRHNDMGHLASILGDIVNEYAVKKTPINRRFIVAESIYLHTGDVAPLAEIVRLKHKYKFRLLLDESLAVGVLGVQGRGLSEEVGAKVGTDVDILVGNLGNALTSVGGFCVGDREMVDHQRLSASGFSFSASNPPVLVNAAQAAVHFLRGPGAPAAL